MENPVAPRQGQRAAGLDEEPHLGEKVTRFLVVAPDGGMNTPASCRPRLGEKLLHQLPARAPSARGRQEVDVDVARELRVPTQVGTPAAQPPKEPPRLPLPQRPPCGPGKDAPRDGNRRQRTGKVADYLAGILGNPRVLRNEVGEIPGDQIRDQFAVGEETLDRLTGIGGFATDVAHRGPVGGRVGTDLHLIACRVWPTDPSPVPAGTCDGRTARRRRDRRRSTRTR